MLRTERPTPDANRIRTPEDALYYSAGIPYDYWKLTKGFRFQSFKLTDETPILSDADQLDWWQRLLATPDMYKQPQLVYVCCRSYEQVTQACVFDLAKTALRAGFTIQVDNSAHIDPPVVIEPFAVLQNVSAEMTTDRRQVVRDWIYRYDSAFRVLCVDGDPMLISARLGIRPTLAFLLNPIRLVQA